MLRFKETPNHYIVTEIILDANNTKERVVKYSKDLMFVQINKDPVRKTISTGREWFEEYYRKHFEEEQNA